MKLETMTDLYVNILQDMYSGEKQLIKALPKMAKGATSPELAQAFESHLVETKAQAERLEQILTDLGKKPGGETCEAIEGLIAEGGEMIEAKGDDTVRDAGLIVAAQKVEHYEIAGYGSLCTFAKLLGRDNDATLLAQTLEEEKQADETLNALAETSINSGALAGTSDAANPSTNRRRPAR